MITETCDGCGQEIGRLGSGKAVACLRGERVDGMGGGGIPSDPFVLCNDCSSSMFKGLASRVSQRRAMDALKERARAQRAG